jgi:hypothetical protein
MRPERSGILSMASWGMVGNAPEQVVVDLRIELRSLGGWGVAKPVGELFFDLVMLSQLLGCRGSVTSSMIALSPPALDKYRAMC